MTPDSFGLFLYELRRRRGLSQKRLGELLGLSGKAVSKWECGLSMPQSNMLPRLAEVLNVSLDELLSCGTRDSVRQGSNLMKNEFWKRVYTALHEKYGENPPLSIINRLETERTELQTPQFYFAMQILTELKELADSSGHHFTPYGYRTYGFALYLLGFTPINPLPAHYYCPKCRTVEFVRDCADGWDLMSKPCACGASMTGDGHNIPWDITVTFPEFYSFLTDRLFCEKARQFLADYPGAVKTPLPNNSNFFNYTFSEQQIKINPIAQPIREAMYLMEQATNTSASRIDFRTPEILNSLLTGDCEGIPWIGFPYARQVIAECQPKTFAHLAKITGMICNIGTWLDNGQDLLKQGIALEQLITCREDIYMTIRDAMIHQECTDFGFAVTVTEETRRGHYLKTGMDALTRKRLLELDLPEWFIGSLCKLKHLTSKHDNIRYTRDFMIFQWYRLHCPGAFAEAMKVHDEMN